MDHDLEWIIPYPGNDLKLDFYKLLVSWKYWKLKSSTFSIILEILEIGFFQFSHILEILEIGFFYFLISWKYGRRAGGGGRAAPGVVLCCLGLFLGPCSWIGDM